VGCGRLRNGACDGTDHGRARSDPAVREDRRRGVVAGARWLLRRAGQARAAGPRVRAGALDETASRHVDYFVVQGVDDTAFLDAEVRRFAERAKRDGRIRYFGFATHKNMAACLRDASALGWIDGLLTAYNYRLMQHAELEDAVALCAQRGIALTAIKSQGLPTNPAATVGDDGPEARALIARLAADGLSEHRARLMAVWSNPNIASIWSMIGDETTLLANAGAAAQWQRLRAADLQALWAIGRQDYALAEARCPQRIQIGKLMRSAGHELA
jgi:hypothetical protein